MNDNTITTINISEYIDPTVKKYIRQEPYVNDEGIFVPIHSYVEEGLSSAYKCVMTKEMFIEAHNKYIKGRRMYKGGWKRRC